MLNSNGEQLAARAGVPDGVINIVTTEKNVSVVGKEMCESKDVKKVTFTGSTAVAKLLAGMAASTLKKFVILISGSQRSTHVYDHRVSLEAGGNAPFVVFDDANLEEAVAGA